MRPLGLALVPFLPLLAGCSGARPILPDLAIEVRHERGRRLAPGGITKRESHDVWLISLRLPSARRRSAVVPEYAGSDLSSERAPCASATLCLWEERARARALFRLARGDDAATRSAQ